MDTRVTIPHISIFFTFTSLVFGNVVNPAINMKIVIGTLM